MDQEEKRGLRKQRVGIVVSTSMNKTIVVNVERRISHPLYGKQIKRAKKYHAHDENNEACVGDVVRISETRPMSKLKRWRLNNVVRKNEAVSGE